MKAKVIALVGLVTVFVLSMCYEHTWAESKTDKAQSKMGIVSIRKIFDNCKRNAKYKQEAMAEQDKIVAELEKLSKEIDAEKTGLKAFNSGSTDHLAKVKLILEKQASLQAQQEFQKQQLQAKDQKWTEKLYQDILNMTAKVAEQKGLDMVFEEDDVELPAGSANELALAIRTHKLLYTKGCLDITDEVTALVDAEKQQ
jgi:Skp family chaperone for outer membrane proteins